MWQETLHQLTAKVAALLGEKTQFAAKIPDDKLVTFEQEPLNTLLPYENYDEDEQLFFNKNSAGFILELTPLTGASEEVENILTNLLTDIIPAHSDVQILLHASNKIEPILQAFKAERSHGQFAWLTEQRIDFLRHGINDSLAHNDSFLLRNFKLYLVFSLPKASSDRLSAIREDIQSALNSIKMMSQNITINNFINLMEELINPNRLSVANDNEWQALDPLNIQLTDPEYRLNVARDRLLIAADDQFDVRSFTVKRFPKEMTQWKMTDNIGQLFNSALQIPCPFVISLHIRPEGLEESEARTQSKFLKKDSVAKSPLAKFQPNVTKEQQDWQYVRQRLAEGDRLVKVLYQVVLYAKPEHADSCEVRLKNLYTANGWKLHKEKGMQFALWLAMLPMQMTEGFYQDLKLLGRLRTLTAFNAVTIAPLQAEWKGTASPQLLFVSRRGQLVTWTSYDTIGGNYNVAIAAASGSGKSVLTQEYIMAILGTGGRVWVIDIGRSYERTCEQCQGQFIRFGADSNICINPFTFITNFDESLDQLKPLAAAMVRPSTHASDEEMSYLEQALKAAWHAKNTKATFTDVAQWLNTQPNNICRNLGNLLYSYTKDGMYSRYFEGACNIAFNNPFIVLELEELKNKKDLQRVVLLVLMQQITERMYLGDRLHAKACIIDEAWDLLKGDNKATAEFIETGYRRARRYTANFVTITQSINDYFQNAIARAAYENSDSKIILRQTPEAIDDLKKSQRLSIDNYTEKVYKSLKSTNEYSEFVLKTNDGMSINRLVLDPYARILYSSKGKEFEAVRALQRDGYSLHDAVMRVAQKFRSKS